MPPLRLHAFTCLAVLIACVAVVTTETVVGVVGRTVVLPCRLTAAKQSEVDVCWGRGQPSLFTCDNMLVNSAGEQVTYRRSYRYSLSSSPSTGVSSLLISNSRVSDSGFYHCRLQLPGFFNDQTFSVHLIIIKPPSVVPEPSGAENQEAVPTTAGYGGAGVTGQTGSDVTAEDTRVPVVAAAAQLPVQLKVGGLQSFVGNTVRISFIVFIPALLLTAAYRVWRSNQRATSGSRLIQSEKGVSV